MTLSERVYQWVARPPPPGNMTVCQPLILSGSDPRLPRSYLRAICEFTCFIISLSTSVDVSHPSNTLRVPMYGLGQDLSIGKLKKVCGPWVEISLEQWTCSDLLAHQLTILQIDDFGVWVGNEVRQEWPCGRLGAHNGAEICAHDLVHISQKNWILRLQSRPRILSSKDIPTII